MNFSRADCRNVFGLYYSAVGGRLCFDAILDFYLRYTSIEMNPWLDETSEYGFRCLFTLEYSSFVGLGDRCE
jgi:hypothetical protein